MKQLTSQQVEEIRLQIAADSDLTFAQLVLDYPGINQWELRQTFRDGQRDLQVQHGPDPIDPGKVAQSEFTPRAKSVLSSGFFRPVEIKMPPQQRPIKALFKQPGYKYLILSDIHAGIEDAAALDVAIQVGQAAGVDELVIDGDAFDCSSLSKYTPAAERPYRWVDERREALPIVARVREAFAKKPATFIFGNHDTRPERFIAATAPQLQGLFTLPQFLGIDSLDFVYPQDNRLVIANKLLIVHGTKVRKDAGASVKAEVQESGMSVVMGHVHRRGWYEITTTSQEIHGDPPLLGVELGCLCKLHPPYLERERTANWQQGAAIVSVYGPNDDVDVSPIRITNGKALFWGRVFESRLASL